MALKQDFWSIRLHNTMSLVGGCCEGGVLNGDDDDDIGGFEASRKAAKTKAILIPVQSGKTIPFAAADCGCKPLPPRRMTSKVSVRVNCANRLDPTALGWASAISPDRPMPCANP